MSRPGLDGLDAERRRVVRHFQRYTSQQRADRAASHRLGPRQRTAVGEAFYTHPDVPDRAFPTRTAAARAGLARQPVIVRADYPVENETRFDLYVAGENVGFATTTDRGPDVWIFDVAVRPALFGRGYGTALLMAVVDANPGRALSLSCETFRSSAWDDLDPVDAAPSGLDGAALAGWYGRHGFRDARNEDGEPVMTRPPAIADASIA